MELERLTTIIVPGIAVVGVVALAISAASGQPAPPPPPGGDHPLHLEKNCSAYFAAGGPAGGSCTFVYSNIPEIKVAPAPIPSMIFGDQAFGIPTVPPPLSGLAGNRAVLDSNVLIYVGTGDWAVGRCTLDGTTFLGHCTISDGVGSLAGFHASWDVSGCPAPPTTTAACPVAGTPNFAYTGTYSFSPHSD
jgi:hypothetical protein